MLRIISFNVNGLRAALRKGFLDYLSLLNADIICLQEIRCKLNDLEHLYYIPYGWSYYYNSAVRRGYSGVAIYIRSSIVPKYVKEGFGAKLDHEGRYLELDLGSFKLASIYLPSGSNEHPERQKGKYGFMHEFYDYLYTNKEKAIIVCGDWNIAHKEIDLANWKQNRKSSGFLDAERIWLSSVLDDLGFVDTFRALDQEANKYTWWSNRGNAYNKNVGWRIDYQIASSVIANRAIRSQIDAMYRISDHAPLIIDWDLSL